MFSAVCSTALKVLTSTGIVAYVTEETWDPQLQEWVPTKWSSEYSPTKLIYKKGELHSNMQGVNLINPSIDKTP